MVDETATQNGKAPPEPLTGPAINYESLAQQFGEDEGGDEVTFSSGVVVKCKGVPTYLIARAIAQMERPQPPLVMIEEKGREEPWPMDPDYRRAVQKHNDDVAILQMNMSILFGTEVVNIPEGTPGPDDQEGWLEPLAATGVPMPETPSDRRLLWMRTIAMPTLEDQWEMIYEVGRRSGTSERDVTDALARFRPASKRGTDPELSVDRAGSDGDQPREEAGGDGAGV